MSRLYTDFSKRDYTANYERLLALLTLEVPELTDRNHSDGGISIIRLLGRQTDMLSFYADEIFSEGFVETAKFRQSLIDIATVVDCRPKISSCASCVLTVEKLVYYRSSGITPTAVNIPAYSIFYRTDGVPYINIDPISMPTHIDEVSFNVFQLEKVDVVLVDGDFEYMSPYKRLRYNLGKDVVSDFFLVKDVVGDVVWDRVDSFYRSLPTDTHYMLELYADDYNGEQDTVFITIGDGIYGTDVLPNALNVTFFRTQGPNGNCGSGMITGVPSSISQYVICSNTTPATGGSLPESTELFRARIPKVVQTQRRGITEGDYDALIISVEGVLDCQTVSRSSDANWPYMYVFIYVLPEGGGVISDFLTNKVRDYCKVWGHMGDWDNRYVIMPAVENVIDVSVRVGKSDGIQRAVVSSSINAALEELFEPEKRLLGKGLSFSDLHRTISSVAGVSWVEFLSPSTSIPPTPGHTYTLGDVTINYGS